MFKDIRALIAKSSLNIENNRLAHIHQKRKQVIAEFTRKSSKSKDLSLRTNLHDTSFNQDKSVRMLEACELNPLVWAYSSISYTANLSFVCSFFLHFRAKGTYLLYA